MKEPKIWKVTTLNYKVLQGITEVSIEGKSVVIKSKNGIGKSSFINAIWTALTGSKEVPKSPIHENQKSASIEVEIKKGDDIFIVRKEFRENKRPALVVQNKNNTRHSSPQKMIDELIGNISFDVFDFIRKTPLEQKREFERLFNIDLSSLEKDKAEVLSAKRDKKKKHEYLEQSLQSKIASLNVENMEIKKVEEEINSIFSSKENFIEAEDNYIKISGEKVKKEEKLNNLRHEYMSCDSKLPIKEEILRKTNKDISDLELMIKKKKEERDKVTEEVEELRTKLSSIEKEAKGVNYEISILHEKMPGEIQAELVKYNELQRKLTMKKEYLEKENKEKENIVKEIKEIEKNIEKDNNFVKDLELTRTELLAEATKIMPEVSLTDEGIQYKGFSLSDNQISHSEIIKIGIKFGMLLNPELKIVRIPDWSEIDSENRKEILKMLKDNEYQLFAEEVTDDPSLQFEIVDETPVGE